MAEQPQYPKTATAGPAIVVGLALGTGVGAALGAATGQMGVWLPIGIAGWFVCGADLRSEGEANTRASGLIRVPALAIPLAGCGCIEQVR